MSNLAQYERAEQKAGRIKWYNPEKRFGFIFVEDSDEELFFTTAAQWRHSDPSLAPVSGERVFFEAFMAPDGKPAARNITYSENNAGDGQKMLPAPPLQLPAPPEQISYKGERS